MSFDYCVHFAKRAHRRHGIHRTVECHEMLPMVGLWGHGRVTMLQLRLPCIRLSTHSLSNAKTQICRTLHVWPVWLILHGTIPCGFRRLPSPVKISTYMFRDSCRKQAVQDRQIKITNCTWLEVLHSHAARAVQGRDLSKMLSNNVL